MATGRPDDLAHHFGDRVLRGMRVTAERTIEDLYREQALGLFRFALLLTGDLTTAEDLVQDAFLGLHRQQGRAQDRQRSSGPHDAVRARL
jgi:DNA-directed RNA polymerase specialized sigma24 family protein